MNRVPGKIVIGFDGSAASEAVLADIPYSGLPDSVEATVLCSADVLVPPATGDIPEQTVLAREYEAQRKSRIHAAEGVAAEGVRRLRLLFPKWTIHAKGGWASPAWALISEAEETGAELIVVGAHSHSKAARFLGSVSQQVLIHANCSVRVARAPQEPAGARTRVLLTLDGSAEATAALDVALGRKWLSGAQVRILSVTSDPLHTKAAEELVASAGKACADAGITATTVVRSGDPKSVVLDEAAVWGATGVLMGARGMNAMRRFLIGSVSQAVASRAECSVEVVR